MNAAGKVLKLEFRLPDSSTAKVESRHKKEVIISILTEGTNQVRSIIAGKHGKFACDTCIVMYNFGSRNFELIDQNDKRIILEDEVKMKIFEIVTI